jgi:SAM-dependent methyltransferase
MRNFDRGRRSRLSPRDFGRFAGDTLFDRIARAVCRAETLPRRELYESWEVARRARRRIRGGRVLDLACGHGLVAHIMLLLDPRSTDAVAIDRRIPVSAARLHAELVADFPQLEGRVAFERRRLTSVTAAPGDVLVSVHACGVLTDLVIDHALGARAPVAVLPCCHDYDRNDTGALEGWLDAALAIDVTRAAKLRAAGYRVHTQTIPDAITAKNRLLLGVPRAPSG